MDLPARRVVKAMRRLFGDRGKGEKGGPVRTKSRAADLVARIVKVRTKQLELRLQANRRGGALIGEGLYRAGELDAALADLRAELGASERPEELELSSWGSGSTR